MKALGYIVVTILLLVYSNLMNGWALVKLWHWFIVPTFGLPGLSIPAALGISLVVTFLTHQYDSNNRSEQPYWATLAQMGAIATVKPLFAVLFGAIIKIWM